MRKIIIAIDGFSACGKSTMAKDLAKQIGYIYIDSGAMYRAITLYCLQNNLIENNRPNQEKIVQHLKDISIEFKINESSGLPETFLNGKNVEKEIRTMEVSNQVSPISAIPFIRKEMVLQQQRMGITKGIIMDGRDIGTAVFPEAELKIFVTASPNIRAQRRLDELKSKGDTTITFDEVLDNLEKRDYMDQHREENPLVQAEDALVLDNSNISKEQQMEWLLNKFNQLIHNE